MKVRMISQSICAPSNDLGMVEDSRLSRLQTLIIRVHFSSYRGQASLMKPYIITCRDKVWYFVRTSSLVN